MGLFFVIVYAAVAMLIAGSYVYMEWPHMWSVREGLLLGFLWPLWVVLAILDGF